MSTSTDRNPGAVLQGTWRNTNSRSVELSELTFFPADRGLVLRVTAGALAGQLEAPVAIFVDDDSATAAAKVLVRQDLPALEIVMHGWIKQGVLVLAIFRRHRGKDTGSSYFDREFFYRADGTR